MEVLVSVNCTSYNHEKYISRALDSFLQQETDFAWEIVIHDDASTDGTARIIREYAERYPDMIKPLLQTENQHTQGIKVNTTFNIPRSRGKYIAFCDGDDYWCDPHKLQKQVDYLEAHPECSMCFHKIRVISGEKEKTAGYLAPCQTSRIVPVEDVIDWSGFTQLSSIVFRRQYMENPPDFYWQAPAGDVFWVLNLAINGTLYYFNEVMSVYRTNVSGSWTSKLTGSHQKKAEFRRDMIKAFAEFDRFTDGKYAASIEAKQAENELLVLISEGNVKGLKTARYKEYHQKLGIYPRALIYMNKYFPGLYEKLRRYRTRVTTKMK